MKTFKLPRLIAAAFAISFFLIIKSGLNFFVALAYMATFLVLISVLVFLNKDPAE